MQLKTLFTGLAAGLLLTTTACTDNAPAAAESTATVPMNATLADAAHPSMIELTDLEGNPINMDQYAGKTLFINFWATWCQPCLREMPSIQEAKKAAKEVVFLFASNESADQIREFGASQSYDFQYVRVNNLEALGVEALPTTWIFDGTGRLVFDEAGTRNWNDATSLHLLTQTSAAQ